MQSKTVGVKEVLDLVRAAEQSPDTLTAASGKPLTQPRVSKKLVGDAGPPLRFPRW